MNRALTATLTCLCLAGYLALPAFADESTTSDATDTSNSENKTAIAEKNGDASAPADSKTDGSKKSSADAGSKKKSKKDAKKDEKQVDKKTDKKASEKAPDKDASAKTETKKTSKASDVDLATRVASFTTGVVVGTPLAIVRRTHMEVMQGEHDLIGDYDSWWKKVLFVCPGAAISIPFGAVSGGIGGCVYSVKNAWTGSGEEPFGKESFSLGDIGN